MSLPPNLEKYALTRINLPAISAIGVCAAVAAIALLAIRGASAETTPDATELLRKSLRAVHLENEQSVYRMRLFKGDGSPDGERVMKVWFRSTSDEASKLTIKFLEPANVRGTALLTLAEKGQSVDQWIYLPAYKKSRRIRGGNENEAFLGSDFTMADLTVDRQSIFEFKVQGSTRCENTDCHVLVGTPKKDVDPETVPYSKKILHIRKDNFLNVRSELYNKEAKLEKVMKMHGLRKIEVENLIEKHKTVLEYDKRDTKTVPEEKFFTLSFLERSA